jgi:hypothetical protein
LKMGLDLGVEVGAVVVTTAITEEVHWSSLKIHS